MLAGHVRRTEVKETLSHVLVRAATGGRLEVVEYLLLQDMEYDETVFTYMRMAVERILGSTLPDEITANERLYSYQYILRALAERHRWNILIQPLIDRGEGRTSEGAVYSIVPSYMSGVPVEVWQRIVRFGMPNHLHDVDTEFIRS